MEHRGKTDPVELILKLAYLDGRVTTRGLIERVVMNSRAQDKVSDAHTKILELRLQNVLEERRLKKATGGAMTLGQYLLHHIEETEKSLSKGIAIISQNINEPVAKVRKLCNDLLVPTEIDIEHMCKLLSYLRLSRSGAEILIRNSYKYAIMRPSIDSALARYPAVGKRQKKQTMLQAVRELCLKSDVILTVEQQHAIESYIRATTDLLSS